MNESLLILIYQVKMFSILWQAAKIQLRSIKKILVSNICHIEFFKVSVKSSSLADFCIKMFSILWQAAKIQLRSI